MLHGIIRAATAALVFVIAILVYINYFRSSDTVLPDHSELATAPEVPKVPASPDAVTAAPTAEASPTPPSTVDANPRLPRAEILDNGDLAEVVELPPSNRPRVSSVPASVQAPQSAPALIAKPTGKRTHVVQPGESLWSISRKYLGSGELNAKIAEANGLTSKDHIRAGQLLVIPDGNAPMVAQAPVRPAAHAPAPTARVSEDLADDDDARRMMTKVSQKPDNRQPAFMNTSVQNKYNTKNLD